METRFDCRTENWLADGYHGLYTYRGPLPPGRTLIRPKALTGAEPHRHRTAVARHMVYERCHMTEIPVQR